MADTGAQTNREDVCRGGEEAGSRKDAMARMDPLGDRKGLEEVLRSIDELMEWRFVDALGRVVLDSDMLTQGITAGKLQIIRACVVRAIEATEGGAR